MSQDALNPEQFFHGTTEELKPGDVVRPSRETGRTPYKGEGYSDLPSWRRKHVWMTNSAHGAFGWANYAAKPKAEAYSNAVTAYGKESAESMGHTMPRLRAYEVEPQGEVKKRNKEYDRVDPEAVPGREFTTSHAVVKREIERPPRISPADQERAKLRRIGR